jgi:hypothetical protein
MSLSVTVICNSSLSLMMVLSSIQLNLQLNTIRTLRSQTQPSFGRTTVELLRKNVLDTITGEDTMNVLMETPSGELSMLDTFILKPTHSSSLV